MEKKLETIKFEKIDDGDYGWHYEAIIPEWIKNAVWSFKNNSLYLYLGEFKQLKIATHLETYKNFNGGISKDNTTIGVILMKESFLKELFDKVRWVMDDNELMNEDGELDEFVNDIDWYVDQLNKVINDESKIQDPIWIDED